ncbi:MAG: hypothetical protein WCI19_11715 [Betaproteobacteria bacterium]|nr:hypothetical protein [Rhodocyclales bacterium]
MDAKAQRRKIETARKYGITGDHSTAGAAEGGAPGLASRVCAFASKDLRFIA